MWELVAGFGLTFVIIIVGLGFAGMICEWVDGRDTSIIRWYKVAYAELIKPLVEYFNPIGILLTVVPLGIGVGLFLVGATVGWSILNTGPIFRRILKLILVKRAQW